jgi:hypothetical protein
MYKKFVEQPGSNSTNNNHSRKNPTKNQLLIINANFGDPPTNNGGSGVNIVKLQQRVLEIKVYSDVI